MSPRTLYYRVFRDNYFLPGYMIRFVSCKPVPNPPHKKNCYPKSFSGGKKLPKKLLGRKKSYPKSFLEGKKLPKKLLATKKLPKKLLATKKGNLENQISFSFFAFSYFLKKINEYFHILQIKVLI